MCDTGLGPAWDWPAVTGHRTVWSDIPSYLIADWSLSRWHWKHPLCERKQLNNLRIELCHVGQIFSEHDFYYFHSRHFNIGFCFHQYWCYFLTFQATILSATIHMIPCLTLCVSIAGSAMNTIWHVIQFSQNIFNVRVAKIE